MLDIVNDSRNRMGMLKPTKGTECPSGADGMALCQTVLSLGGTIFWDFRLSPVLSFHCSPWLPVIFWDFTLEYWDGCCIEDRDRMPFGCGSVAPTTAWYLVRLRSSTQKGKDVETDDRCPICSSAEVPMMRDSMFWSAVTIFIYPIQETVFLEPAFLGFWLNDSHISDLPIFH